MDTVIHLDNVILPSTKGNNILSHKKICKYLKFILIKEKIQPEKAM